MTTRLDRTESHNIVGILPGTDPAAGSILYGAHWDAYGENAFDPPADRIRNGAIDNGTGTATLLDIARAFAAGARPRRSVMFALWTAEEKGLLGATWYADHPALPLATTAASTAEAPGIGTTRPPSPAQALTTSSPGSLTPGVPASGGLYAHGAGAPAPSFARTVKSASATERP